MKIAGLGTVMVLAAAAASPAEKAPKCFNPAFEGHCVAALVNGQKTVRVSKETAKMLKPHDARGSRPFGNCTARYEVPAPVRGELKLGFAWLPEAAGYFGDVADAQVNVYPLDGQSLETRPEISTARGVQAEGSAVVTQADVIQGNHLPPGRYVLTARVFGSARSWECHGFVIRVAE